MNDKKDILTKFEDWCNMFDDYTCGQTFTPSFVLKKIQSLRAAELEEKQASIMKVS